MMVKSTKRTLRIGAILFFCLTIEVAGGRMRYSFGPGLIKGSYRIDRRNRKGRSKG